MSDMAGLVAAISNRIVSRGREADYAFSTPQVVSEGQAGATGDLLQLTDGTIINLEGVVKG
jgi:hypothetical protein